MRFFILALTFLFSTVLFSKETNYVPHQVLVRFEPRTDVDLFWAKLNAHRQEPVKLVSQKLIAPYMNIWKLLFDGNVTAREMVNLLSQKREVLVAQVNHKVYSRSTPNDPFFDTQWQWQNIAAEQAWDITTGGVTDNGDTIVVAIIDDGTQLDHPDLMANTWHNWAEIPDNGVDDDGNGYVDDFNGWNVINGTNNVNTGGHGISVAGMIGASGNDNNQGVGVNWDVKMMTIVGGTNEESEVIESYSYALNFRKKYNETNGAEGAFVVATNSSWGLDGGDPNDAPLWCAFYDSLGVQGILSCGATANNAVNIDVVGDLPTACPSDYLISVTATDINDFRDFSAWGLNTIDIGAPGDNIYTSEGGGSYGFTSGTSFASPLTAGVVALLYSAPCPDLAGLALSDPGAAALLVRDYIFDGVDTTSQLMSEIKTGGRINAAKSMTLLMANCGACTPPFSINVTDLLDVSATLNFSALNDGAHLYYRQVGATEWDTVMNVSSPYAMTNLTACMDYELALQSVCADSLSEWSPVYTFKTDGCCDLPANFHVVNTSDSALSLAWDNVLAATGYEVIYAPDPYATWDTLTTTNTSLSISNLAACTAYQVKIRTLFSGQDINYSNPIDITTTGCGACIDSVYCESSGGVTDEFIDSVEVEGVFVNPSGANDNAYDFFSNLNIEFVPSISYNMIITPGYVADTWSEHVKVWIDFNQNGIFEDAEAVIDPDFTITEATTFPFTIDPAAIPGLTRMRVMLSYYSITGPCGTFEYGEVEDYCVNISGDSICVPPFGVEITDITDVTSVVNFSTLNDAANLYYRPTSSTEWDSITNVNSPYQLTGLMGCTNYELKMSSVCADSVSNLSESYFFKTDGCCVLPDSFNVANITNNAASLSWEPVFAASSFDIIYAQEPFTAWDTINTTELSLDLTGLQKCTDYAARIRTHCSGTVLPFSDTITFKTFGCGACLDLTYCPSQGGNTSEYIDTVEVEGIFINPTGPDLDGYALFSDMDITFFQDSTYDMTITPGYSNFIYGEYVAAWIDFNQNGSFEEEEKVYNTIDNIDQATTLPIYIPEDAIPGLTRMRIQLNYNIIDDPCGSYTYGEVEDYCVNIKENGYCLGPDSLFVDDIQYYSAVLNWAVVDSSISYIVKHRKLNGDWEAATTTSNSYELNNLDECTEYEAQIRAVCSNGLGIKTFNTFKTECVSGTTTPFGENAFTVYPNPFSDEFEVAIKGYPIQNIQVRLYDMLGREIPIRTSGIHDKMVITPSNSIMDGVYMLQLRTAEHTGIVRVIKE